VKVEMRVVEMVDKMGNEKVGWRVAQLERTQVA
jgi:hypothetical protein